MAPSRLDELRKAAAGCTACDLYERGVLVSSDLAEHVLATVHPSSILRHDPETREQAYGELVHDLKVVARLL